MSKLNVLNKTAIIRKPGVRGCPYGLGIATACHNAGTTVNNMVALIDVKESRKAKQGKLNRRVYAFSQVGERCIYADKIVEDHDIVNCDFLDSGEGMRDFALKPTPFYPRLYNNLGQNSLYSYHLTGFEDGIGAQNQYVGMYGVYASGKEVNLTKSSEGETDMSIKDNILDSEGEHGTI